MVAGPHLSNFHQTREAVETVYTTSYKTMVSPTEFASRAEALAFIRQLRPRDSEFALQHRIDHNMKIMQRTAGSPSSTIRSGSRKG